MRKINQVYGSFELVSEWEIEGIGNSRVFILLIEDMINKYMYETGPELQIIDDLNYLSEVTGK